MSWEYVPTSIAAICGKSGRGRQKVRIFWEPFGRPTIGFPDKGDYRCLEGEAYLREETRHGPCLWVSVGGVKHLIAPGEFYVDPDWDVKEVPEGGHLGHHGLVFGREHSDGGFYPVGIHPVLKTAFRSSNVPKPSVQC